MASEIQTETPAETVLEPEVEGTGWDANDKWTQLLREQKESDAPKVNLYHNKRNAFYKLGYNENHIPKQSKMRSPKKPRLEAWDKPELNWPPRVPRPSLHTGKTLIGLLEHEEKHRLLKEKPFEIPDYRSGDVVKITVMGSKSEKKEESYSGVVVSKAAPNSIHATCKINFAIESVNTIYGAKLYSPMVTNFEILKYGSNKNKKKLLHIPRLDMSAGRMQEAIVKGRGFKPRAGLKEKIQNTNKSRNRGMFRK